MNKKKKHVYASGENGEKFVMPRFWESNFGVFDSTTVMDFGKIQFGVLEVFGEM
jgi:hypothetical protein